MRLSTTPMYYKDVTTLAQLFETVGHSTRLQILYHLIDHDNATITELSGVLLEGSEAISQHVEILIGVNFISAIPRSNPASYALNEKLWNEFKMTLKLFVADV